jgi:hypothetical protein
LVGFWKIESFNLEKVAGLLASKRRQRGEISTERLLDGRALIGKEFRTLGREVRDVLKAHSELAVNHDRWFDAEAQAGLNRSLVPAHDVCPFMTVQTNAVSSAMREPWNLTTGVTGQHAMQSGNDFCVRFSTAKN